MVVIACAWEVPANPKLDPLKTYNSSLMATSGFPCKATNGYAVAIVRIMIFTEQLLA
jgi:hypothetical protein